MGWGKALVGKEILGLKRCQRLAELAARPIDFRRPVCVPGRVRGYFLSR